MKCTGRNNSFSSFSLSIREAEILELLCLGFTNREIAKKLVVSIETVKTHIASILKKMNVRNRVQAACKATTFKFMSDLGFPCEYEAVKSRQPRVCDGRTGYDVCPLNDV